MAIFVGHQLNLSAMAIRAGTKKRMTTPTSIMTAAATTKPISPSRAILVTMSEVKTVARTSPSPNIVTQTLSSAVLMASSSVFPFSDLLPYPRDEEDVVVYAHAKHRHDDEERREVEYGEPLGVEVHDDEQRHREGDAAEDREDQPDRGEDRPQLDEEDHVDRRREDDDDLRQYPVQEGLVVVGGLGLASVVDRDALQQMLGRDGGLDLEERVDRGLALAVALQADGYRARSRCSAPMKESIPARYCDLSGSGSCSTPV